MVIVKVNPKMKKQQSEALCTHCIQAAVCNISRETEETVLACEAFLRVGSASGTNTQISDIPEALDSSRAYGLCGDCENRGHCIFRQREGGVWHCEEYC